MPSSATDVVAEDASAHSLIDVVLSARSRAARASVDCALNVCHL